MSERYWKETRKAMRWWMKVGLPPEEVARAEGIPLRKVRRERARLQNRQAVHAYIKTAPFGIDNDTGREFRLSFRQFLSVVRFK